MYARYGAMSIALSAALVAGGLSVPALAQEPGPAQDQENQVTAMTRGPLHEAFAEVVTYQPQPGLTVAKKPPGPVQEVPPEQKPEGDGFVWISGYWAWDEDRDQFIWVSGVWRRPPPGNEWVPGYWIEAQGGFQWVSGYWRPIEQEQTADVEYLPQPPETLEQGPSSPQPSEDYFWVPGCWVWHGGRYAWQAGYWSPIQEDWTWMPARYVWTPGGFVFVRGHWDYAFWRRGLCYAPVYFHGSVYGRPGFRYVPGVVLDTFALFNHLFLRPTYHHYYFGDYYDGRYRDRGFQPWFAYHRSRIGYDPIYAYSSWYYSRQYPDWPNRIRGWYDYRAAHADARPPHTLAATLALGARPGGDAAGTLRLATTAALAVQDQSFPIRLARVEEPQKRHAAELQSRFDKFAQERRRLEQTVGQQSKEGKAGPRRVQIPDAGVREAMRQLAPGAMTGPAAKVQPPPPAKPEGPLPGRPSVKPERPLPGPSAKPEGPLGQPPGRVEQPKGPPAKPERPSAPQPKPKLGPGPQVLPQPPQRPSPPDRSPGAARPKGKLAEGGSPSGPPKAAPPPVDQPPAEKPRPGRAKDEDGKDRDRVPGKGGGEGGGKGGGPGKGGGKGKGR